MMTRHRVLGIISRWLSRYSDAHGIAILSRRHVTGVSRWGWELRIESVAGPALSCHWDHCGEELSLALDINGELTDFAGTKNGLSKALEAFEEEANAAAKLVGWFFVGDTGFDAVQIQRRSPVITPVIVAPALNPKPTKAIGVVAPKEPKPTEARKDRFELIEI